MNKNPETTETATTKTKGKRGAPTKPLFLPDADQFTFAEVTAINQLCNLSAYRKLAEMVRKRELYVSAETRGTGGVGKPATIYVKAEAWTEEMALAKTTKNRKKAALKSAKARAEAKAAEPKDEPAVETKSKGKSKSKGKGKSKKVPVVDLTPETSEIVQSDTAPVETISAETVPTETVPA
jgi:hypothetical protein